MKNILVLGYFGYLTNQIDGQTIKTRQIYNLLNKNKKNKKIDLFYFDTQSFKGNKYVFFKLISILFKMDTIYYLPGKNNLIFIFPIIFLLSKLFKFKIVYPVVGGWLSDYLYKKRIYVFLLKRIKALLVESEIMVRDLENKFGFKNVELLYNFRDHDFVPSFDTNPKKIKLVFMARVIKEKGIYKILELVEHIKTVTVNFSFNLDFYGPIGDNDRVEFLNAISEYPNVNYKGIVEPDQVFTTLNNYDLLLLPTFYEGEGFPGSIVDAYISGVPVVVSNWKMLPSFVDQGNTGYVFSDEKDFYMKVLNLLNNISLLDQMKLNAHRYSKKFSAENSKETLLKFI